jgi:hypothetical protein
MTAMPLTDALTAAPWACAPAHVEPIVASIAGLDQVRRAGATPADDAALPAPAYQLQQATAVIPVRGPILRGYGWLRAWGVEVADPDEIAALIARDPKLAVLVPPVEGGPARLGERLAAGEFPLLSASLARMVVRELMSQRRLRPGDANLGAILETVTRNGAETIMAQRYLPAIKDGDTSLDEAFPREGVKMPVEAAAPISNAGQKKPVAAPEAPAPAKTDAAPAYDRETVKAEIAALIDASKAAKIAKAMRAVGIGWQDGEAWEEAPDEALRSLASLLRC